MAGQLSRWLGRGALALVLVLATGASTVWVRSNQALALRFEVPAEALSIPTDSGSIARGRHLASAIAKCTDCHGNDLGGQAMAMGPMGTFVALNLTSGKGGVAPLSDADWVRAIRHAVAPDGRSLVFMPSLAYNPLNASDLGAIIAYIKSVPPVDHELPPTSVGPIGRVLLAKEAGKLLHAAAMDHAAPPPAEVPAGPTAEYGTYLSVVGGCTSCHGMNLKGGLKEGPPGTPASADLTMTGPLGKWSEADFRTLLRTGLRPDGSAIDPFMPWRWTREMTDEEITAVWLYLKGL